MKRIVKLCAVLGVLVMITGLSANKTYADDVINISTAEQFLSIGKNPLYPLDGDYVLSCDIDMSGKNHVPIGTASEPFTGTFDGASYAIKNINIEGTDIGSIEDLGEGNITGYGIFGVIKNSSLDDKVVISNLHIYNATISDEKCVDSAAGILSAFAYNGVIIKNVSITDATIELKALKNKTLYGAGGLLGVVWTDRENVTRAKTEISDIYTKCTIKVSEYDKENTVSGVVGCVYNKAMSSISRVLSFGTLTYNDEAGYGIATSRKFDGNGISEKWERVYYALEDKRDDNGIGNALSKGVLACGKVALSDGWQQSKGILPVLKQMDKYVELRDLIYPSFRRNQSVDKITEDFLLPISNGNKKIEWSSSSKNVVVDNATGDVKITCIDGIAEDVKLTYKCDGETGSIGITIGEKKSISFDKNYVKPNDTLKVLYAPVNSTYKWEILDKKTNTKRTVDNSTSEYMVTEEDLESFIYVTINGKEKLSIYVSTLPVVYIDGSALFSGMKKTSYYDGTIKISGDSDEYPSWDLYEGAVQYKGRGHSSSYYEKIGIKLKLNKKSDMYGVSGYENKHWVLVSNVLDSSFMRNAVVDRFFTAMDASSIMDYTDVILIYNGDYKGVYQLFEHVRIADGRVDIFDYDKYAKEVADIIASHMVKKGELSEHFEKSYAEELKDIMESDYSYLKNGYVDGKDGRRYELKEYGIQLPEATGGYLVCMDRHSADNGYKQATLHTAYTLPFYIDKPSTDEKSQLTSFRESSLYDYAVSFNQSLEYALHSDDFFFRNDDKHYKVTNEGSNASGKWTGTTYAETIYKDDERDGMHYSEMVDIDSLAQYFLVCEFSQNYDSTKNSFYYQKDIGELAVVAPFWDYDWSMGNFITIRYTNMPTKWQTTLDGANELYYQHVSWNRMLIRDPYFLLKVWEKYGTVKDDVEEIVKDGGFVDSQHEKFKKVYVPNDLKWGHLDVFRGFENSVSDLRKYLNKRVEWLDKQFESFDTLVESLGYYHASDYLKVDNVKRNEDKTATIEVSVNNKNVANITFQVNGTYQAVASVIDGKASITVPAEMLDGAGKNIVEVKAMDKNKSYIVNEKYSDKGNYNLIHSNYYVFE